MRNSIICLIILLFNQCAIVKNRSTEMMDITYKFVKSIHTKDSRLFYCVVNKDSLKNALSDQYSYNQTYVDDLNKIEMKDFYFYRYSPLKIRNQDLEKLSKSNFPFEQLNYKCISLNANRVVLLVECFYKITSKQTIEITLYKFKTGWKVTSAIPK